MGGQQGYDVAGKIEGVDVKAGPEGDEEADVGALGEILGFHIRLAHGAVYRHFTETFQELDLTQKQVSVMWLIADHPGLAQTDVGKRLRMDRATTMALINRLQARKLVRRGRAEGDRRKQALFLEPAGEEMLGRAKQAVGDHEAWLKSRFTPREVNKLIELLTRIHG
jgi:DNA-binding MarR family transcriptional regulator